MDRTYFFCGEFVVVFLSRQRSRGQQENRR